MIKSLKRNDIRSTPFVANKSWNSQNQTFDNTISWQSGSQSGSLFLSFVDYKDGTQLSLHSSSIAYQQQDPDFLRFRIGQEITGTTFYPTSSKYYDSLVNPTNIDGTYQGLVYNTLKNLFYKETANPTQIFGLESLNPVDVNRTLTKQINVFNVPQNKFGEKIVPNSIEIKQQLDDGHFVVIDDGNTNLKLSGSHFVDVQNAMYNCVSAIINVTNTSYTYDGSPKSASVTTNPSDLITITTYNGSETPPTNVGTYTILSTIWDGYYCGSTGSTFIINKAVDPPPTITVTNVVDTYDGNPHYATATTIPSDLNYTIVYTLKGVDVTNPIDVGVYTATATVDDGNYTVTGIGTVTITPPTLTVNFDAIANQVYGTTTIELIASSSPFSYPIKYTITSGDTLAKIPGTSNPEILLSPTLTATSLGSVTVKAETTDLPTGFTSSYATQSFNVTPKPITLDVNQIKVTYSGSGTNVNIDNRNLTNWLVSQNPSQLVTGTDTVTISGPSVGTIPNANAGTPNVTLGSPYTLGGTHAAKYSLTQPTLKAVVPAVDTITLTGSSFDYDGNAYTIKDIINKGCAELTSGTYTIKFFNDKGSIINEFTQKYYTSGQVNTNIGPFSVGEYIVTITNENSNPKEIKEAKLTINKAPATIVLDNLTQGGINYVSDTATYAVSDTGFGRVSWNDGSYKSSTDPNDGPNYSTLIPNTFAENIKPITVRSVTINDRNSKTIDLLTVNKILYTPTITSGTLTQAGTYTVKVLLNTTNVYGGFDTYLTLSDFYYVTLAHIAIFHMGQYVNNNNRKISIEKYYDPTTGVDSAIRTKISDSISEKMLIYNDLTSGGGGGSGMSEYFSTSPSVGGVVGTAWSYGGGGAGRIFYLLPTSIFKKLDTIYLIAGASGSRGSVVYNKAGKDSDRIVTDGTPGGSTYIVTSSISINQSNAFLGIYSAGGNPGLLNKTSTQLDGFFGKGGKNYYKNNEYYRDVIGLDTSNGVWIFSIVGNDGSSNADPKDARYPIKNPFDGNRVAPGGMSLYLNTEMNGGDGVLKIGNSYDVTFARSGTLHSGGFFGGNGLFGINQLIIKNGMHKVYKNTFSNVIYDSHPELEYQEP